MKRFKISILIKRRFIYFFFVLFIILCYSLLAILIIRDNNNNHDNNGNEISDHFSINKKGDNQKFLKEDDIMDQNLGTDHFMDLIKIKNEREKTDWLIKKYMLDFIKKPLKPEEFVELKKREDYHTSLWNIIFGQFKEWENPIEVSNYKQKLQKESSFLTQKNHNHLFGNRKFLSIVHQALYPWLYGFHYHSFSDIVSSSNGRGIVICTGNYHFKYARSTIDILRNVLNTELPIEVFYNGERDLSLENRNLLINEFENIYLSDITNYFDNNIVNISGWAIKPFSILASRFEEVILMDADALFLRDPIELFKEKGYQEKGTLFFRDRTLFPGENSASKWLKSWLINPLPETKELRFWNEQTEHEMESSTVVIHKIKTILGLLNVCKLNEYAIRQDVVYNKVYGDKETYWIGYDMARQPYYMSSKPCAFVGEVVDDDESSNLEDKKLCGHTAHTLENGKLMFWNGHLVKDKNIGMYKNELLRFEAYAFEDNDKNWSINLACLNLGDTKEPIYFDEEELEVYNKIMEREKLHHYLITERKRKKKPHKFNNNNNNNKPHNK
ncbi:mannosyltransferase putative-domain-containing protein [Neocallimastix sp. 'constans']